MVHFQNADLHLTLCLTEMITKPPEQKTDLPNALYNTAYTSTINKHGKHGSLTTVESVLVDITLRN
jgi:hypothetical protein